jgi:hypothetical protein
MAKADIGLSVSTKSFLRLFGYAWLASMTVLIVVIAGIDWLADFRAAPHIDFSRWTYLELIAGLAPGIVALVLAGRTAKR